jgi:hypothetical protein
MADLIHRLYECLAQALGASSSKNLAVSARRILLVLQGLSPRLRGVNAALLCSSAGGGGGDGCRLSDRALAQLVSGAAAGSSRRLSQGPPWDCGARC